jgi:solute carrier family 25 (mitochondrial carnitine/acylcarnitine transporter), member 20/29
MAANNVSRGPTVGQVSPENSGRVGSLDAVKQIVQRRGLLGLYTGFQLHLARDTIGTGVFFGVYESTKMAITAYRGGESNSGAAISIAGALCGIMSWCLVGCKLPVRPFQLALD